MIDFFAMGGYAVYVWPSFALTAFVVLANLFFALHRRKKVIATLKRDVERDVKQADPGN